jgi:hypothetical protein
MASVIRELLDSIDAFETKMNENLKKFKYDDTILDYLHLRINFRDMYDIALNIDSKAYDVINNERTTVKFIKNEEAYDQIQKLKSK